MRDQNHLVRFGMNVTFTLVSPDTNKRGQILPECKLLQDGSLHCKVASDILQGVLVGLLFEGPSVGGRIFQKNVRIIWNKKEIEKCMDIPSMGW